MTRDASISASSDFYPTHTFPTLPSIVTTFSEKGGALDPFGVFATPSVVLPSLDESLNATFVSSHPALWERLKRQGEPWKNGPSCNTTGFWHAAASAYFLLYIRWAMLEASCLYACLLG